MPKKNHSLAKQKAGYAAAAYIQQDMVVGIGTGSTVFYFIEALAKRCKEGLRIKAVASSTSSFDQAKQLGIPLLVPTEVCSLDCTVDGADEIDLHQQMIKGGGGALLREKILAYSSKIFIVIVDETKVVQHLGKCPVPVEISPFLYPATKKKLEQLNYSCCLRQTQEKKPFITDNNNYIIDIFFTSPISDAKTEHNYLKSIPGVLETGLFFNVAKQLIVGYEKGTVKVDNFTKDVD